MKSGRRSFGAGIQASGHEPKNSQLRKLPNPRNRMLSDRELMPESEHFNLKSCTAPKGRQESGELGCACASGRESSKSVQLSLYQSDRSFRESQVNETGDRGREEN
jgi:hypothetical protein